MVKKGMGFKCEEEVDGSKTCKRIVSKKKGVYATGTDVQLIPDPETCKVRTIGNIMDEDQDAVDAEIKRMEAKCKKGFR